MIPWEELTRNQVGVCERDEFHPHTKCKENTWVPVCRSCGRRTNHDERNHPADLTLCFNCDMLDQEVEMGMV